MRDGDDVKSEPSAADCSRGEPDIPAELSLQLDTAVDLTAGILLSLSKQEPREFASALQEQEEQLRRMDKPRAREYMFKQHGIRPVPRQDDR